MAIESWELDSKQFCVMGDAIDLYIIYNFSQEQQWIMTCSIYC